MADTVLTKKITDLPEGTEINDADLIMTGVNGTASLRKNKWSKFVEKLRSILFVDSCASTETGYGLTAKQGKLLQDQVNELNTNMRYLKKFEYSPITLQANVTKSVTVPLSGLSGKTIDAAIVTLRGGIPYMASINSIDSNAIEVSLKADGDISNRMIVLSVFYH